MSLVQVLGLAMRLCLFWGWFDWIVCWVGCFNYLFWAGCFTCVCLGAADLVVLGFVCFAFLLFWVGCIVLLLFVRVAGYLIASVLAGLTYCVGGLVGCYHVLLLFVVCCVFEFCGCYFVACSFDWCLGLMMFWICALDRSYLVCLFCD